MYCRWRVLERVGVGSLVDGSSAICEAGMEWDGGVCVAAMVMGTGAQARIAEGSVQGVSGRDPMIVQYGW